MTPSSVFVAKVKSKFGTGAVVDNKKIVTVAVMRDKAMICCNALNGFACAECDHPERCAAFHDMQKIKAAAIN
jgi:hypothetical protein